MEVIQPSRRGFLTGLGAIVFAAPAIVKASSLMPVRAIVPPRDWLTLDDYSAKILAPSINTLADNVAQQIMSGSEIAARQQAAISNHLMNVQMITREAINLFSNSNEFIKRIDGEFDAQFGRADAKIGKTLRIRLPSDFKVTDTFPLLGSF